MAVVDMAQVPEALVEVTVYSDEVLRSQVGRCQRVYRNAMQDKYTTPASFGGFPVHTSDLLTCLDRGEEAWIPDLQSSDESEDEGSVKPTLKRWPKGGMWWDRYRSPAAYPSSDSTLSGEDQESEVEDEKPQHSSHRLTILHRNLLDVSKGNGSNSLRQREACRNGSQVKKPSQSQVGKLTDDSADSGNVGEKATKEKTAEEEQHCLRCNRIFKSKISLANHQRIHSKGKVYECSSCEETFTTKKNLVQHLRSHKEGKGDKYPSNTMKHGSIPSEKMPYKCLECSKCFMLKDHLLVHQKNHTAKQPYICLECGKSFIQKGHLLRHQKIHRSPKIDKPLEDEKEGKGESSPEPPEKKSPTVPVCEATVSSESLANYQENQTSLYKCQFCGKYLRSKSLLVDHERIHREERPYKCLQCKKSFHYKYHLLKHKAIHTKPTACKLPKKRSSSPSGSVMLHVTENTSEDSLGGKILTRSIHLAQHPRSQASRLLYQCQYCGKSLRTSATLADHEKLHTGERPFKCEECAESYIRKHHLIRHQEIHSRQAPFKHVRRRKMKTQFAALERIHTKKKLNRSHGRSTTHNLCLARHPKLLPEGKCYKCQYCGKCLKTKSSLIKHGKIHKGKKPYQCLECKRNFSRKNHLFVHQRSHVRKKLSVHSDSHQKVTPQKFPSSLKRANPHRRKLSYLCHNCGKSFGYQYTLTKHERIHSGHKPFKCVTCGKGFVEKYHMKRHERIHQKEKAHKQPVVAELNCQKRILLVPKPFICSVCGKGFVQTRFLKTHERTHLREKSHKQPVVAEVDHVFSNPKDGIFSEEKNEEDPLVNDKPKTASRTEENCVFQDIREENCVFQDLREENTESLALLGERSKMGALGDSEQEEIHVQVQAKLSRTQKRNVFHNHREAEASVSQFLKSERKPKRKNSAILPYRQDKPYIHQQHWPKKCSRKKHLQTCKKGKVYDLQLRSQATSRRKSKREIHLRSWWARSCCLCQQERPEMTSRRKSPNIIVCKKAKASNSPQRDLSATVSSRLLKSAPKSCRPKGPCLSLSSQRTSSGESKMETTESIDCGTSFSTEQQSGQQEVLERKQEDPQSGEPDLCESLDATEQTESQALPLLSQSNVSHNFEEIQPTEPLQSTALQNQRKLSIRQQPEVQLTPSEAAGKPIPQSHMEGGGCSEPLRTTLCAVQSGAPQTEIVVTQHQHEEVQTKHVCSRCMKSFRSQENLLIHEKSHKGNKRPFLCTQCGKSFCAIQSLYVHMQIHTGEKPFRCSKCNFRCNVSSNLSRHKRTHVRERPFPCLQCGESFWFSHSLFVHLRIHHVKEPHKCPDCGRKFSGKNLFMLHRKYKHNSGAAVSAC